MRVSDLLRNWFRWPSGYPSDWVDDGTLDKPKTIEFSVNEKTREDIDSIWLDVKEAMRSMKGDLEYLRGVADTLPNPKRLIDICEELEIIRNAYIDAPQIIWESSDD